MYLNTLRIQLKLEGKNKKLVENIIEKLVATFKKITQNANNEIEAEVFDDKDQKLLFV